jgi:rare lipoprotein A
MASRLSAAMCGVAIAITCSTAATAASEIDTSRSKTAAIVGAASTYNPFKPGWREGGPSTASGERYDPSAWAAAIKTNLRKLFGGVKFREPPKFALVEAKGKKVVVKINDVGPLTPGRIIDLNERTMRHFDPSLKQGVIQGVKVTPLAGNNWTLGPVVAVAGDSAG